MGIKFEIIYHEKVVKKDIPTLSKTNKEKIKKAIEEKLTISPEVFGKPLRKSLKNFRRLRVGDFRIVFRIENKKVKIFYIGHRSVIYQKQDRE